ncbi:MAG TPA: AraC family transcriptional regulator [Sphingomicrobium sp.]|jgi:AraC-like DNA-binding protein|nr:AraC family transcriptional regulator [Sphingomicrobium sp.]
MALRPICEPVELPIGAAVLAEHVTIAADTPQLGSFRHFHDVAELVLFRRVRGEFIAGGHRYQLADGAIAFVPSMHDHDYALARGEMEWVLVQIDPYIVELLAGRAEFSRLSRPFCAFPDGRTRRRLESLADWLIEAVGRGNDAAIEKIVELLLIVAAEAPEQDFGAAEDGTPSFDRLLPALERLRSAPDEPIPLEAAASICSLSPAYFSRRFKQALGMNFTDYARVYRLHLAARRLATTGSAISKIGYSLGFSSPSHFTARFRERFGMTPREYRSGTRTRSAAEGEGMNESS